MGELQKNLETVFEYYCRIDPSPPKLKNLPEEEILSLNGVLKFCYNYSIIDRFVQRKVLSRILNQYSEKGYLNFNEFLSFLRELSYVAYRNSKTITQTSKLKRFLSKLNLKNQLDVKKSFIFNKNNNLYS